jgi:hypothetical protein
VIWAKNTFTLGRADYQRRYEPILYGWKEGADSGRDGEVRHLGRVENRREVVRRLVERLRRGGQELRVCYEAGSCGYGLHRQLTELRCHCVVVAPALIPRRPGDRVKTDRTPRPWRRCTGRAS